MDEDRIRRIVREEIAMALVTIVRTADANPLISPGVVNMRDTINSVADGIVAELARTSRAGEL